MNSKVIIFLALVFSFPNFGKAQTKLNVGGGYFGDAISHPGVVLEFEIEKFHGESFSLPLKADLGYFTSPDYQVLFLDIHKGFRKYFQSGLFVEQSIGIGMMSTFYDVESIFYKDKYANTIRYYDGANISFMPSVSAGIGYNLTKEKNTQNLIWFRPKVYWNLGFRGLHLPYAGFQIGFSHNFKTK